MTQLVNDDNVDNQYKYLLYKYLNELPHNQYKITSRQLPKKLGVSAETFRKWKYIKKWSNATIPADKLAIIANFFEIRIEEIFNYVVPKLSFAELEKADQEENENSVLNQEAGSKIEIPKSVPSKSAFKTNKKKSRKSIIREALKNMPKIERPVISLSSCYFYWNRDIQEYNKNFKKFYREEENQYDVLK